MARGNNMKSKPVGNQVSIARSVRAAWNANRHSVAAGFLASTSVFLLPVYVTWQNEPWYRPDRDRAPITLLCGRHTAGLCVETGEEWQRMCQ